MLFLCCVGKWPPGLLLCLLPTLFFVGLRRRWSAQIGALGLALSIGGISSTRAVMRSCRAMLMASVGDGIGVLQLCGKNTTVLETRVCRVDGM